VLLGWVLVELGAVAEEVLALVLFMNVEVVEEVVELEDI
jgi:hypothetical protein